jgi:Fic family protein
VELLSVSAYLKEHGRQYEKAFEKVVENDHDVTYFIDFCLDSMGSALKAVSLKINYLLQMMNLRKTLNLTDSQIGLLQRMALHKFRSIDIETYAKQIKMSRESARHELKRLVELDLLSETKVSKKFVYRVNAVKLKEVTLGS